MPTNCLSVLDHFVGLALKGIRVTKCTVKLAGKRLIFLIWLEKRNYSVLSILNNNIQNTYYVLYVLLKFHEILAMLTFRNVNIAFLNLCKSCVCDSFTSFVFPYGGDRTRALSSEYKIDQASYHLTSQRKSFLIQKHWVQIPKRPFLISVNTCKVSWQTLMCYCFND